MKDRIRPRVLLIDDDLDVHEDLAAVLGRKFTFTCVQSAEQGIALVGKSPFSVVLLDIGFPDGMDGHQALEILLQDPLTPPVIMLTGDSRVDSVVRSIKAGAFHYASKRSNPQELGHLIERAVQHHEMTLEIGRLHSELEDARGDLVAVAPASRALLAELEGIADTDVTVLLTGESGTGKEILARHLHGLGPRSRRPFIPLNCVALPRDLIESELFGHEKGSFTHAERRHLGAFEQASGGTLFLDEIGDASPAVQARLLRVLNDKTVRRIGGESDIEVDVRLVAATNRDLEREVAAGRFRRDLYYRLNLVHLHLPPLRERSADVPPLARHFLARAAARYNRPCRGISAEAEMWLMQRRWHGNVRELENLITGAVVRTSSPMLRRLDLLRQEAPQVTQSVGLPYKEAKARLLSDFKAQYVRTQLDAAGGVVGEAARRSGLTPQGFRLILKSVGVEPGTSGCTDL